MHAYWKYLCIFLFISQTACAQERKTPTLADCEKIENDKKTEQISCFTSLAEKENIPAQIELAGIYYENRNAEKAVFWFQKAAAAGNADGENMMGTIYERGTGGIKDYNKAFEYYLKAANRGQSYGQANTGRFYLYGIENTKMDYQQALKWLTLSANQNNPIGARELGGMYLYGRGVKEDVAKAVTLFEIAANVDDTEIQTELGKIYFEGMGNVPQNYQKALYWFEKAANNGEYYAQRYLVRIYGDGLGVKVDEKKAKYWFQKSMEEEYSGTSE